ncbi:MAG: hypothetical protein QXI28_02480 [Candidatus Hadarchaeales archaeon]
MKNRIAPDLTPDLSQINPAIGPPSPLKIAKREVIKLAEEGSRNITSCPYFADRDTAKSPPIVPSASDVQSIQNFPDFRTFLEDTLGTGSMFSPEVMLRKKKGKQTINMDPNQKKVLKTPNLTIISLERGAIRTGENPNPIATIPIARPP